ncbi:hypothetical protein HDU98_003328, partial [Podochytrium sp. JEL0797]
MSDADSDSDAFSFDSQSEGGYSSDGAESEGGSRIGESGKDDDEDCGVGVSGVELRQRLVALAQEVSDVAGCSAGQAALLLRNKAFAKDALLEQLFASEGGCDKALRDAGVEAARGSEAPRLEAMPGFECSICFANDPEDETAAMSCGHRFCLSCYQHYITQKIVAEGECRVQCLDSKCKLIVNDLLVKEIVDKDVYEKFEQLVSKAFVEHTPSLTWCPSPDCSYAIECKSPVLRRSKQLSPVVTCPCGNVFCFGCSLENHQPTPCSVVKMWLKKCADDSETANWIHANTKDCPKCDSSIEKNGGCNHLHCRKCNHHFCWVCMGDFPLNYKHSCALWETVEIDTNDTKAQAKTALQRYIH